ncbi:DUF4188 domain-containing protein [Isoptericola halotolerans]|uniref:DUF4188 domain-containing protein n=1 Tax=Isoptericola halotolerans TaxID=300560 RepID=A0ABX2A631_9MICO|nr:DUF4188 domain-containing protein [Isoptericola halotolerans]NOV98317.1 hypothetical protein [Isoptericola halotolerans]
MTTLMTHHHDGALAVFLIGARINKFWRPDAWVPTYAAMGPMLAELHRTPETGFLGARTTFGLRGPTVIQYWRSVEDIYRYANDDDLAHRPAWIEFHRRARKAPGAVGIWHETYAVGAGGHESLYGDMPPFGLARATTPVPAQHKGRTARERLRASGSPRTPPPTPQPR